MTDTIKPEVGKTYLTRDGQKARCICTDRRNDEYPVVCLVSAKVSEAIETYTANGRFHSDQFEYPFDLVSEAPRVVTLDAPASQPVLPGELVEAVRDHVSPKTSYYPDTWKRLVAALASLPDPLQTVESVRADERERLAKLADGGEDRYPAWIVYAPRDQSRPVVNQPFPDWLRSQKGEG